MIQTIAIFYLTMGLVTYVSAEFRGELSEVTKEVYDKSDKTLWNIFAPPTVKVLLILFWPWACL